MGILRGDKTFYKNVGGSFNYKFGRGDSEHTRPLAEEVREEDMRVSSGYER